MASGASNRQKHREAEAGRMAELSHATRRLGNLSPEQAAQARRLMDQILGGVLRDPDAVGEACSYAAVQAHEESAG